MRPDASFIGQPIRSLQTMLRVLAEKDDYYETLIPDGIYGKATMSAVARFQQRHGLDVTGIADQDTWDAIVAEYEPALIYVDEAQSVDIILNPGQILRRGERNANLYLVQAILMALSDVYSSIPNPSMNGILDDATADSVSSFQMLSGLPMTGQLDKHTWKHLALHFPLATNLEARQEPRLRNKLLTNY